MAPAGADRVADSSPAALDEKESAITVVLRVRPLSAAEVRSGQEVGWDYSSEGIAPKRGGSRRLSLPERPLSFDRVYGPEESTRDIYTSVVESRVAHALADGVNAAVIAYGQTCSGALPPR